MNISHPETLISRNTQKYRVWQKTLSLLLCALLVFSYLPFSNIALTTRELASIKGSGLGEAADESASYMSVTSTAPVISDAGVAQDTKDAPAKDSPATGTEPSTDTTYPPIASKAPAEEAPAEEELPPADDQQQGTEHAPGPSVDSVVMQSTAYTCGPAALATLLKMISGKSDYYRQIIDMAGTDNSGTSLLALKRSAEALGYEAAGLRLGIEELAAAGPVLAHVVIGGYHHFTVVEGIADGSVFLADPQLGRVNIPTEQFKSVWNGTVLKVSEAAGIPEENQPAKTPAEPVLTHLGDTTPWPATETLTPPDMLSGEAQRAKTSKTSENLPPNEDVYTESVNGAATQPNMSPEGNKLVAPSMQKATIQSAPDTWAVDISENGYPSWKIQPHTDTIALIDDADMKQIMGRGFFLPALAVAKIAIKVAPKILPRAVRVINNPRTQHRILQTRNTGRHLAQIGNCKKRGEHVAFGANKGNPATGRWHIYRNHPWRINPYR